jgi:hypothetical protein
MGAGPKYRQPNARYLGYRGEQARAWTWMKQKYGAYWIRASNGEAFAQFGPNPYSTSRFANLNDAMIAAYREEGR